jgi:hypothetical protein
MHLFQSNNAANFIQHHEETSIACSFESATGNLLILYISEQLCPHVAKKMSFSNLYILCKQFHLRHTKITTMHGKAQISNTPYNFLFFWFIATFVLATPYQ